MAPDEGIEPPLRVLETPVIPLDQSGLKMVGVDGFEPPTSASQRQRSTRLTYTP